MAYEFALGKLFPYLLHWRIHSDLTPLWGNDIKEEKRGKTMKVGFEINATTQRSLKNSPRNLLNIFYKML